MAYTYRLYLLGRHLLIKLPEGLALLDPGRPFSSTTPIVDFFGEKEIGLITWLDKTHEVNTGGVLPKPLTWALPNKHLEKKFLERARSRRKKPSNTQDSPESNSLEKTIEVYAVLGMDFLNNQNTLLYDLVNQTLNVGGELPDGFLENSYETDAAVDAPIFRLTLNGHSARVLWDTSAGYGYVTDRKFVTESRTRPGFKDSSDLFGDLDFTRSYELPFTLSGHDLVETVVEAPEDLLGGVSPVSMRSFLRALEIDVTIGNSWMPRVKVWLNPLDQTFAVAV
jgi:hypothetical protein